MSKILNDITEILVDDKVISSEYTLISIRMSLEEMSYSDMDFYLVMYDENKDHTIPIMIEEEEFNNLIQDKSYTAWLYAHSTFGQKIDIQK